MVHTIQTAYLQFSYHPESCTWSVVSPQAKGPSVENAQVNVFYHRGFSQAYVMEERNSLRMGAPGQVASIHGPLRQVELLSGIDGRGISLNLTFALPEEHPLLLWKLAVQNRGKSAVYIDRLDLLNAGFVTLPSSFSASSLAGYRSVSRSGRGVARPAPVPGALAFFTNGWQSWSYSGVYGVGARSRSTRLRPLRQPVENPTTPRSRKTGLFAADLFGVLGDRLHRTAILAGFLSQKAHFGSLEVLLDPFSPAMRLWASGDGARLDPGQVIESDWACLHFLHLDTSDPLGPYLEAVARENGIGESLTQSAALHGTGEAGIPTGWCSWYGYSSEDYLGIIDAEVARENLEAVRRLKDRLPLEVFQIDDGFQTQVGDWLSFQPAFPHGVSGLAGEIREAGFTPGLWLAPFIAHPRSHLAQEHPDWLVGGRWGRPANAGFFCNAFTYALDLTHPAALEYAADVVHTAVHEWGYPYLKLDFLYAGALFGRRRDPTRTRAQALRTGLEVLRQAAGSQAFLLGCGCPLGPAIGLVDAMRVSADTAGRWLPAFRGRQFFVKGEATFPAARNALHNVLTRAPLHRRWWVNDPDCLLLRPELSLTQAEIETSATVIALTGGSLLLSDPLANLPPDRLRIAEALLPLIGKAPYVLDWFDAPAESGGSATPSRLQLDLDNPAGRWHLLALFNWMDQPRSLVLNPTEFYLDPQQDYLARSFWDGRLYRLLRAQGCSLTLENVPAHGVILLAARPARLHLPQYLGGSLHISQGMELVEWKWDGPGRAAQSNGRPGALSFRLSRPGPAQGCADLALPGEPREGSLNGQALGWQRLEEGIYRLELEFERQAEVILRF